VDFISISPELKFSVHNALFDLAIRHAEMPFVTGGLWLMMKGLERSANSRR
jgi:hypothetical protein